MITSFSRGHEIFFENGKWLYIDTKLEVNEMRPCKKCNLPPTKDGYDACLGKLENVQSACCGHGVHEGYVVKDVE